MIHRKDETDAINVRGLNLDGIHLEAFAASVHRAKFVTKIILRDCGLTDKEGISIVKQLNKGLVKHLDMSENSTLSGKFYEELGNLMEDEKAVLERIEIEDNQIGDQILIDLVEHLLYGRISYLNVSKNGITDVGAVAIAKLIRFCPNLRLLFLHYNKIMGIGGLDIAHSVGLSKSLQVFDISFNSITGSGFKIQKDEKQDGEKREKPKKQAKKKKVIGGDKKPEVPVSFAELFAQGFSEPWAAAFRRNKSLLHVDMSHNHISLTDVEIIADGLKDNHSILGIHFIGNDGDVDAKGFVNPQVPFSVGESSVLVRMQTNGLKGGVVNDSRKFEL